jgi:hypothetical protein
MKRAAAAAALLLLALCGGRLSAGPTLTPPEHRRPPDQTFLTYPEWFLVFSPAEYAAFAQHGNPSEFPFLGHIRQFWEGYDAVWNATRGRCPFNAGYHLMIVVIGTSTTGEYAVRRAYETVVGRIAEMTRTHGPTQEERFAARAAQEYVDFIRIDPWYEFDFISRLRQLWTRTDLVGPDMIRKWERKYALTSEYAAKAIYGAIIKKATKATYEAPLPTTAVVTGGARPALLLLPRYEAFMPAALSLAQRGTKFREIAGNRDVILLSLLVPVGTPVEGSVLLRQPILTRGGTERVLVAVPIASLDAALRRFSLAPFAIEHVFDF